MEVYINRARNINEANKMSEVSASELEAIYTQYYKNVYNYVSFRINNHYDAEELASNVFENIIRRFNTYKPSLSLEAWIIGIAKNVVTDYLRAKMKLSFIPLDAVLTLVSDLKQPGEVIVIYEENRELIKAMATLKDKERQILSMKFATDLKNREIAKVLSISESSVAVIIHRATRKLRKVLGEER